MVEEHHLSRVRACRAAGLPRSALYRAPQDQAVKDAPVIDAINRLVHKRPRWGFWKCFQRLRADGRGWNHKRVYRVYCGMRLNLQRKAKRRVITRDGQPLLTSQELNRVWALDFMRDTLYDGRPFRTLNVIDEGNRAQGLRRFDAWVVTCVELTGPERHDRPADGRNMDKLRLAAGLACRGGSG